MCSRKMARQINEWTMDLVGQRYDFKAILYGCGENKLIALPDALTLHILCLILLDSWSKIFWIPVFF